MRKAELREEHKSIGLTGGRLKCVGVKSSRGLVVVVQIVKGAVF
jgi:hypothetical protein